MTSYRKINSRKTHKKLMMPRSFHQSGKDIRHQRSLSPLSSFLLEDEVSRSLCSYSNAWPVSRPISLASSGNCTVSSNTSARHIATNNRHIFGMSSAQTCHDISYLLQLTVISSPALSPPLALLSTSSIFGTICCRPIRLASSKEQHSVRRGGTIRLAFTFCDARQVTSCGPSCATSAISPSTRLRRC